MVTLKDLKKDEEISSLISVGEEQLSALGYTEHSVRHASIVSNWAGEIIEKIGGTREEKNLAEIAGYLHDIGNSINRCDHAQSGALLAYNLLISRGMDYRSAAEIMMAIGNHDEHEGMPVGRVSAALIIADKADVHRSRVRFSRRTAEIAKTDIHDRVNYAAESSYIEVNDGVISLNLKIDTDICPVMDYFEIYFNRMKLCRQSAAVLGQTFALVINGVKLL